MLFLCYCVVNPIYHRIFLVETPAVIGAVALTSPISKTKALMLSLFNYFKPKIDICRNHKSVSSETKFYIYCKYLCCCIKSDRLIRYFSQNS